MNNGEQAKLERLEEKVVSMKELNDSLYASAKDFYELSAIVSAQAEKIRGLEQRLNDYIASRKYIITTGISVGGLIIALILHYIK